VNVRSRNPFLLLVVLGSLCCALAASGQSGRRRAVRTPPPIPPLCGSVVGTPAVTFSRDGGRTVVPTAERLHGVGYTMGLVALDVPDRLLAVHKRTLLSSIDAGCSWTALAELTALDYSPPILNAAEGGRAYGWSPNQSFLFRVIDDRFETLASPVQAIAGFGSDRHDGRHVRIAGMDGSIWDSRDEGTTWTPVGRVPLDANSPLLYTVAFDSFDLDHILAGAARTGAHLSRDGGRSWSESRGLSTGGPVNIFTISISPADGNLVWAMGLDIREADQHLPSNGRHIYRSEDGGETFAPVVDASAEVTLTNGPIVVPHPTRPELVYFTFGSSVFDVGSFLYTYDHSRRTIGIHRHPFHGINAVAFSRRDLGVMYLGLQVVERNEP
jgi:hypothetical protein